VVVGSGRRHRCVRDGAGHEATGRRTTMVTLGMVVLGLAAFAAMLAFVALCDRV
jgi:hypothetical protein